MTIRIILAFLLLVGVAAANSNCSCPAAANSSCCLAAVTDSCCLRNINKLQELIKDIIQGEVYSSIYFPVFPIYCKLVMVY